MYEYNNEVVIIDTTVVPTERTKCNRKACQLLANESFLSDNWRI